MSECRKLFLGNLPYRMRQSDLEDFLTENGVTSFTRAEVVLDRETNKSRGFGFVHFATEPEALDALKKLDGAQAEGRTVSVDRATERQQERCAGRRGWGEGRRNRERDEW